MYSLSYIKNPQGLSLVEILVVLGLFSGIVTISLATLFNTQAINTKLLQSQSILDNVNLSLQTITRDIRYGNEFYCSTTVQEVTPTQRKGCTKAQGGGSVIYFQPADAADENDRIAYYVSGGILYKAEIPFGGAVSIYQMTSSEVEIKQLKIFTEGVNTSTGERDVSNAVDYSQPLISIFISGNTIPKNNKQAPAPFNVQTHISARVLDNS